MVISSEHLRTDGGACNVKMWAIVSPVFCEANKACIRGPEPTYPLS